MASYEVLEVRKWGRMLFILDGEPFEEVYCLKYQGSQVAADGGCQMDVVVRMNEGYIAWGEPKVSSEIDDWG